jgi:TM2 domain-containing membrane protein YozV
MPATGVEAFASDAQAQMNVVEQLEWTLAALAALTLVLGVATFMRRRNYDGVTFLLLLATFLSGVACLFMAYCWYFAASGGG